MGTHSIMQWQHGLGYEGSAVIDDYLGLHMLQVIGSTGTYHVSQSACAKAQVGISFVDLVDCSSALSRRADLRWKWLGWHKSNEHMTQVHAKRETHRLWQTKRLARS